MVKRNKNIYRLLICSSVIFIIDTLTAKKIIIIAVLKGTVQTVISI